MCLLPLCVERVHLWGRGWSPMLTANGGHIQTTHCAHCTCTHHIQ